MQCRSSGAYDQERILGAVMNLKRIGAVLAAMMLVLPLIGQRAPARAEAEAAPTASPAISSVISPALSVISPAASPAASPAISPAREHAEGWWNILLLGGDARSTTTYARTDSMIILSINLKEEKVKMTSIMRDTWVTYPGGTRSNKINAANVFGGVELTLATVNDCFGTDIEDYVLINMYGLVKVIDQIGGVEVSVTSAERGLIASGVKGYVNTFGSYGGATSLPAGDGPVLLNGAQAMSYARIRSIGTDYARTARQRTVLLAVFEKLKGMGAVQLAAAVSMGLQNTQTNLDLLEIYDLADVLLGIDPASIEEYRVPADGTFESGMKGGYWSIRPDFEANKELLHEFIYGDGQ